MSGGSGCVLCVGEFGACLEVVGVHQVALWSVCVCLFVSRGN